MNKRQIVEAIENARRGISKYVEIMELFPNVNVAQNVDFQHKFKYFYKVLYRSPEWYKTYFSLMQGSKGYKLTFDYVLDYLNNVFGRYEPSFSSKLVATLDPEQPIWDKYVLNYVQNHIRVVPPRYTATNKIDQAKSVYRSIQKWYSQYLRSKEGKLIVRIFNENVTEHAKITDLKKVDFVLWQTRA